MFLLLNDPIQRRFTYNAQNDPTEGLLKLFQCLQGIDQLPAVFQESERVVCSVCNNEEIQNHQTPEVLICDTSSCAPNTNYDLQAILNLPKSHHDSFCVPCNTHTHKNVYRKLNSLDSPIMIIALTHINPKSIHIRASFRIFNRVMQKVTLATNWAPKNIISNEILRIK